MRYKGTDGYVSLEVNPHLAHDTKGTMEEARRMLDRLPELGISIDNVTQQLEDEGVEKFSKSCNYSAHFFICRLRRFRREKQTRILVL